ncbi:unnamed protein product, partial [marine sediment metagenome]
KKYGMKLKIFDFTVSEICRVINGYVREEYRYTKSVRVDSIYSGLKRKGWHRSDAREFIMNIDRKLLELGIDIEITKFDILNYKPINSNLRPLIAHYKHGQDRFHQNHDIAVIELIKSRRGQDVRNIEDSKLFFLTSDRGLNRFNFFEMGHQKNGTVCEAILDSLLTNILWLKKPEAKISLKSLIAVYSRGLFVKKRIWDRFYEILREMKMGGDITDKSISTL